MFSVPVSTRSKFSPRRAETLFADGYTYTTRDAGTCDTYTVTSPKGDAYGVFIEKEVCFGDSCTCPAFKKFDTCKHLEAVQMMLKAESALCEAWDAMDAHNDEYALRADCSAYGY